MGSCLLSTLANSVVNWLHLLLLGSPGGSDSKESAYQCKRHRRCRFTPWVGEIPLEEDTATYSSIVGCRIPRAEEPAGLQSTGVTESQTRLSRWSSHCYYRYNKFWKINYLSLIFCLIGFLSSFALILFMIPFHFLCKFVSCNTLFSHFSGCLRIHSKYDSLMTG